ncbi:prolyl oligopeptidase family serine peptidase, partial [Kibdelosporangium philippinense]|uniref:prolyl oligopeptidase family serine peptidase n=1 Tax=Kibdelosporangium philippinense TaxID=211113 RepID=UPI0035E4C809
MAATPPPSTVASTASGAHLDTNGQQTAGTGPSVSQDNNTTTEVEFDWADDATLAGDDQSSDQPGATVNQAVGTLNQTDEDDNDAETQTLAEQPEAKQGEPKAGLTSALGVLGQLLNNRPGNPYSVFLPDMVFDVPPVQVYSVKVEHDFENQQPVTEQQGPTPAQQYASEHGAEPSTPDKVGAEADLTKNETGGTGDTTGPVSSPGAGPSRAIRFAPTPDPAPEPDPAPDPGSHKQTKPNEVDGRLALRSMDLKLDTVGPKPLLTPDITTASTTLDNDTMPKMETAAPKSENSQQKVDATANTNPPPKVEPAKPDAAPKPDGSVRADTAPKTESAKVEPPAKSDTSAKTSLSSPAPNTTAKSVPETLVARVDPVRKEPIRPAQRIFDKRREEEVDKLLADQLRRESGLPRPMFAAGAARDSELLSEDPQTRTSEPVPSSSHVNRQAAPSRRDVTFAQGSTKLDADQEQVIRDLAQHIVDQLSRLGADQRIVVQLIGKGNGNRALLPVLTAKATGRKRATRVQDSLRRELLRLSPAGSDPDKIDVVAESIGRMDRTDEESRRAVEIWTSVVRVVTPLDVDYRNNPRFVSSDADRAKFKENYEPYRQTLEHAREAQRKHPELAGIAEEDLVALVGYTGDVLYGQLKYALRTREAGELNKWDPHIRTVVSALNQLPQYQGMVQRAIVAHAEPAAGGTAGVLAKYQVGRIVREDSFFRTNVDRTNFPGDVFFNVLSKTGHLVDSVSQHAHSEREVLFGPGTYFQVTRVRQHKGRVDVWMTEVDHRAVDRFSPLPTRSWRQIGVRVGSNVGDTYRAPDGTSYYLKESSTSQHARNEVLAAELYQLAGIDTADVRLAWIGDELGVSSRIVRAGSPSFVDGLQDGRYLEKVQDGFAVDAWLGNYDVVGLEYDNVLTDPEGNPVRIDPGGALLFHATGRPKTREDFDGSAKEWDTLRDRNVHEQAAAVFGSMTEKQMRASALRVVAVRPEQIDDAVDRAGFEGRTAHRLKQTLKLRRQDVARRAGVKLPGPSGVLDHNLDDLSQSSPPMPAYSTPSASAALGMLGASHTSPEGWDHRSTNSEQTDYVRFADDQVWSHRSIDPELIPGDTQPTTATDDAIWHKPVPDENGTVVGMTFVQGGRVTIGQWLRGKPTGLPARGRTFGIDVQVTNQGARLIGADGRSVWRDGHQLAQVVLATEEFRASIEAGLPIRLYACDVGTGFARQFWEGVKAWYPHAEVYAPTSIFRFGITPEGKSDWKIDGKGTWQVFFDPDLVHGVDKSGNPMTVRLADVVVHVGPDDGTSRSSAISFVDETFLDWQSALTKVVVLPGTFQQLDETAYADRRFTNVAVEVDLPARHEPHGTTYLDMHGTTSQDMHRNFGRVVIPTKHGDISVSGRTAARVFLAKQTRLRSSVTIMACNAARGAAGLDNSVLDDFADEIHRTHPELAVHAASDVVLLVQDIGEYFADRSGPTLAIVGGGDFVTRSGDRTELIRSVLAKRLADTGELDLTMVADMVRRTPDPNKTWSAVIRQLAGSGHRLDRVVDFARGDVEPLWQSVVLPPRARARITITGKGTWGSRVVRRPAEWRESTQAPLRMFDPNDQHGPVVVQFAQNDVTVAGITSQYSLDQLALWLVHSTLERRSDHVAKPVVSIAGYGNRGPLWRRSDEAVIEAGNARAKAVRDYLVTAYERLFPQYAPVNWPHDAEPEYHVYGALDPSLGKHDVQRVEVTILPPGTDPEAVPPRPVEPSAETMDQATAILDLQGVSDKLFSLNLPEKVHTAVARAARDHVRMELATAGQEATQAMADGMVRALDTVHDAGLLNGLVELAVTKTMVRSDLVAVLADMAALVTAGEVDAARAMLEWFRAGPDKSGNHDHYGRWEHRGPDTADTDTARTHTRVQPDKVWRRLLTTRQTGPVGMSFVRGREEAFLDWLTRRPARLPVHGHSFGIEVQSNESGAVLFDSRGPRWPGTGRQVAQLALTVAEFRAAVGAGTPVMLYVSNVVDGLARDFSAAVRAEFPHAEVYAPTNTFQFAITPETARSTWTIDNGGTWQLYADQDRFHGKDADGKPMAVKLGDILAYRGADDNSARSSAFSFADESFLHWYPVLDKAVVVPGTPEDFMASVYKDRAFRRRATEIALPSKYEPRGTTYLEILVEGGAVAIATRQGPMYTNGRTAARIFLELQPVASASSVTVVAKAHGSVAGQHDTVLGDVVRAIRRVHPGLAVHVASGRVIPLDNAEEVVPDRSGPVLMVFSGDFKPQAAAFVTHGGGDLTGDITSILDERLIQTGELDLPRVADMVSRTRHPDATWKRVIESLARAQRPLSQIIDFSWDNAGRHWRPIVLPWPARSLIMVTGKGTWDSRDVRRSARWRQEWDSTREFDSTDRPGPIAVQFTAGGVSAADIRSRYSLNHFAKWLVHSTLERWMDRAQPPEVIITGYAGKRTERSSVDAGRDRAIAVRDHLFAMYELLLNEHLSPNQPWNVTLPSFRARGELDPSRGTLDIDRVEVRVVPADWDPEWGLDPATATAPTVQSMRQATGLLDQQGVSGKLESLLVPRKVRSAVTKVAREQVRMELLAGRPRAAAAVAANLVWALDVVNNAGLLSELVIAATTEEALRGDLVKIVADVAELVTAGREDGARALVEWLTSDPDSSPRADALLEAQALAYRLAGQPQRPPAYTVADVQRDAPPLTADDHLEPASSVRFVPLYHPTEVGRAVGMSFMTGDEARRAEQWAASTEAERGHSLLVDTDYETFRAMSVHERAGHIRMVPMPGHERGTFVLDIRGDGTVVAVEFSDDHHIEQWGGEQFAAFIVKTDVFTRAAEQGIGAFTFITGVARPAPGPFVFEFYEAMVRLRPAMRTVTVHVPTGPIVPVGNNYPVEGIRNTTLIFDRGGWLTAGTAERALHKVMQRMAAIPRRHRGRLEYGSDEWLDSAANVANQVLAFLTASINATRTLDLAGSTKLLAFATDDRSEELALSAALTVISTGSLGARVDKVTDIHRDQSGRWRAVIRSARPRQRYVVTGEGRWDYAAGVVTRPARMVPPGESQVSRAVVGDQSVATEVVFERKKKDMDLASAQLDGVRAIAQRYAEALVENDVIDVHGAPSRVTYQLTIEGAGHNWLHGDESGRQRGNFVAEVFREEMRSRLHQLIGRGLADRLFDVPSLVMYPDHGTRLKTKDDPYVRVTLRPVGPELADRPPLGASVRTPPGARQIEGPDPADVPAYVEPAPEDPYIWLEDMDGRRALDWVRDRNIETTVALSTTDRFVRSRTRFKAALDAEGHLPQPDQMMVQDGYFYDLWQDENQERGLWRRISLAEYGSAKPAWETLIDLDELARQEGEDWYWPGYQPMLSPDRQRAMVHLSRGGADAVVTREFDLGTREFVKGGFALPEARNNAVWADDDQLLVATDFGEGSVSEAGYPVVLKEWRRGTPLTDAKEIFRAPQSDCKVSAMVFASSDEDRRTQFIVHYKDMENAVSYVRTPDGLREVVTPDDAPFSVHRNWMTIVPGSPWTAGDVTYPAGALLGIRFDRYMAGERNFQVLFQPDAHTSLQSHVWTRNRLLLVTMTDVNAKLRVLTPVEEGPWPQVSIGGMPPHSSASVIDTHDPVDDTFLMVVEGYLQPKTVIRGDSADRSMKTVRQETTAFDSKGMSVVQYFAASDDGTRVPYFVVRGRDSGPGPALLYGYGGFGESETPTYSKMAGVGWLSRGGTYVVANIRGGGEYGPDWHTQATKSGRHKSFEDFAAVAEDLVRRNITTPRELAIRGGSNGGLLMAVMLTRYPHLFGAVVADVPLTDMLRYHELSAGPSWFVEYGDPRVASERDYLSTYSPYQHIDADVEYPPALFITSSTDDRVHPAHARKMAAKLTQLGHRALFFETSGGGHSNSANAEFALEAALTYEFLWTELSRNRSATVRLPEHALPSHWAAAKSSVGSMPVDDELSIDAEGSTDDATDDESVAANPGHWPADVSDVEAWKAEMARAEDDMARIEEYRQGVANLMVQAEGIVAAYHGPRRVLVDDDSGRDIYAGVVDLVAEQLYLDDDKPNPDRNAVQLAVYLRGAFDHVYATGGSRAISEEAVYPGIDDDGLTLYFTRPQVLARPLIGPDDFVVGVAYGNDLDLEDDRPFASGRDFGYTDLSHRNYSDEEVSTLGEDKILSLPSPGVTGEGTFLVATHGVRMKTARVWIGPVGGSVEQPSERSLVRTQLGVSGEVLARLVMASAEFGSFVDSGRLRSITLMVCHAAKTPADGLASAFHQAVNERYPGIVVHATTGFVREDLESVSDYPYLLRNPSVEEGTWVTYGGSSPGQAPVIHDVLNAMRDWSEKDADLRAYYAARLPLYSVVDRAVSLSATLVRDFDSSGILNLLPAAEQVRASQGAGNADLVWVAALTQLRRTPGLPALGGVVLAETDPGSGQVVREAALPPPVWRMLAVSGPRYQSNVGLTIVPVRWGADIYQGVNQANRVRWFDAGQVWHKRINDHVVSFVDNQP